MPLKKISELTTEDMQMLEDMAGTGFTPEEIAEVLEVEESEFLAYYRTPGSDVHLRYRKGFLLAQVKLRQRIFKDAGFGSSPAQTMAKKIMDDLEYKNKRHE